MWKNGRRPGPNFCVMSLRDCNRWGDLYRLWKWYLIQWTNRSPAYCWVSLCLWAGRSWRDDSDIKPYPTRRCADEAKECGSCYCGKFTEKEML